MKKTLVIGFIGIMAGWLPAADSSLKDKLAKAAKQLGDKPNYSWTTTTKEADGIPGRLAIKEILLLGARRREGQEPPKTEDAKGSVKFWIKEGALTKYEINVQGKVTAGDRTFDINRTMTVEIKDVGSTKLDVPHEAKAKLS